jgi:hypothetical protein
VPRIVELDEILEPLRPIDYAGTHFWFELGMNGYVNLTRKKKVVGSLNEEWSLDVPTTTSGVAPSRGC